MTLEQIGIFTGILSAICTGVYFLNKKNIERRRKFISRIYGQWGNEGDIVRSKYETHFVELEINIDTLDGEITGIARSWQVDSETKSPICSIKGHLKFRSAVFKLIHIRHGEEFLYGVVKVKLKKKTLEWKLINGVADFFPRYTKLYRQGRQSS